jgi:hypothetical protein
MAVRANQEAAFEPNKSGLKGKPHVFESWSDSIIIISIDQLMVFALFNVNM